MSKKDFKYIEKEIYLKTGYTLKSILSKFDLFNLNEFGWFVDLLNEACK